METQKRENLGTLFQTSFNDYKSFFLKIVLVALAIVGVNLLLIGVYYLMYGSLPTQLTSLSYEESSFFYSFFSGIATLILTGMYTLFYFKNKEGENTQIKKQFLPFLLKISLLFIMGILVTLAIGLGLILLIIPGIVLGVYLSMSYFSLLLGNKGILGSIKYSWNLVYNNWWRTLGYLLFIGFFIGLLQGIFLGIPVMFLVLFESPVLILSYTLFSAFIAFLFSTFMTHFLVNYYRALVREKGDSTQTSQTQTSPSEAHTEDINEELKTYIETNKENYSKEQLEEALLEAGHDKESIEKHLTQFY
jgi:hypothetical protein